MAVLGSSTEGQHSAGASAPTEAPQTNILKTVKSPLEALQEIASSQASLENKQVAINAIVLGEKPMPPIIKNAFLEAIEKGQTQAAALIVDAYQTNLADPTSKEVNLILCKAFALAEKTDQQKFVQLLIEKFPKLFLSEKSQYFLEFYLQKASASNHIEIVSYLISLRGVGYKLGTLSSVYTACPQVQKVFSEKIRKEIETHQRISSLKTGISSGIGTAVISFFVFYSSWLLRHMYRDQRTHGRIDVPFSEIFKTLGYQILGSISLGLVVGLVDIGRRLVQQKKETQLDFRELLKFSSDENKILKNNAEDLCLKV